MTNHVAIGTLLGAWVAGKDGACVTIVERFNRSSIDQAKKECKLEKAIYKL